MKFIYLLIKKSAKMEEIAEAQQIDAPMNPSSIQPRLKDIFLIKKSEKG